MPRTRKQGPLNPERIAVEALKFIDQKGLDVFSARKLGARLNVEGMALYKHYPSMDALLDAVAELLLLEVKLPAQQPGGWPPRVRQFARDYRQLAYRHPKAYPLLARRLTKPSSVRVVDTILAALLEEGFEPAAAAELFRAMNAYCNGACLDELAGLAAEGKGPSLEGLKALQRVGPFLAVNRYDALFEAGLEALLTGFMGRPGVPDVAPPPPTLP